jgi:ATP synthase subunit 6
LLPAGAPAALAPFLVLIERIRLLVRPVTLSVRLMANISAGHIVLTLVGNYLSNLVLSFGVGAVSLLMVQVFYTIFEFAIRFIQAYIFCLLLTLYADEHVLIINVAN